MFRLAITVSTTKGAIAFREVAPAEPNVQLIEEHLAVIAPKWEKENV